jgi:hypothetical protein
MDPRWLCAGCLHAKCTRHEPQYEAGSSISGTRHTHMPYASRSLRTYETYDLNTIYNIVILAASSRSRAGIAGSSAQATCSNSGALRHSPSTARKMQS